ncbi:aminotransferase [Desulfosarcina ovata subsp. sediminis]|uniref:Aminotransferase n=1 Tax=Desulfosarcina ovata subsp. sediminis TaxID=885957 RepID=A0A5K7ZUP8_9BACT|nr:pyridoxal phosphate-dependent aminotransferase [Desulfosarcina ovata]BBO83957.1 aminotransferase [Desulfosarcina ovata subsp. sediminis]
MQEHLTPHNLLSPSRRVRAISPSATKQMAIIAARIGGCVSLGQGVPSFITPPHIIEAVTHALKNDVGSGQYSLQTGMTALRQCIARRFLEEKKVSVDPESEICVTVGGMEALLATVMTVVDEGNQVILPSPTYASYTEQVVLAGGTPVYVPLTDKWELDLKAITEAITPRTKALMLCNPGNPTGTVFSDEQVLAICELAVAHGFVVIIDEAYDYMVYGGCMPVNPLSVGRFRDNVISISSLSKKYALTGWRVGWVIAAARWMEQIMKVHDAATICAPTPSQIAALAAMEGDQQCVRDMCIELTKRRALCCKRLDRLSDYFSYVPPRGAFYVMSKYRFTDDNSKEVAIRLLEEAKVITIPGGAFGLGGEGHLRLSFGGEEKVIDEAFDRIERWLR